MKNKLLNIDALKNYCDYEWKEITIGCSATNVFKLTKNQESLFLKVGKSGALTNEYLNLIKLKKYLNVPQVILYYNNDEIEILITKAMKGTMSCDDKFINNFPNETIDVMCDAIKTLQSIKIDKEIQKNLKKYDLEEEINSIKKKIATKEIYEIPNKVVFEKFSNLSDVLLYLENNKPQGNLCLSHGDVSMPNVFIDNNKLAGFIDVGNAGIRQKWYDIADLYVSIRRNFESQEIADKFLMKLGINDKKPIEYYEILINLS